MLLSQHILIFCSFSLLLYNDTDYEKKIILNYFYSKLIVLTSLFSVYHCIISISFKKKEKHALSIMYTLNCNCFFFYIYIFFFEQFVILRSQLSTSWIPHVQNIKCVNVQGVRGTRSTLVYRVHVLYVSTVKRCM